MRRQLPGRRILFLRPLRPPNSSPPRFRPLTQNTASFSPQLRPQVPFLSSSSQRPLARLLSTETKRWIKSEFILAGKITVTLWSSAVLLFLIAFGLQQEWLNHRFPSPDEWTWFTRKDFRNVLWEADVDDERNGLVDWATVGMIYLRIAKRLEDREIDGKGLVEQDEDGILVAGVGKTGFDVSNMSEPWRRGYYQVLMGLGKSAEHLDGWVMDRTRRVFFPANVVIGPSNPNPKPIPAGAKSAPKEEDCEVAFDGPETFYLRILTTRGFTDKQRMDAALAYAVWLDFKRIPGAASEMYNWALDIANPKVSTTGPILKPTTNIISADAGPPSENLLSATTALAVHEATNSNPSAALPMFLSILRARRSLPNVPSTMLSTLAPAEEESKNTGFFKTVNDFCRILFVPPAYPPPPRDGTAPPLRTAEEICEEAGVMTYIGEILYSSKSGNTSREDGLAWTREAVDIAEEQLRKRGTDKKGKTTCAQCLEVGISNWAEMVKQLSREEKSSLKSGKTDGWLGFGGKSRVEAGGNKGRWETEEQVVEERLKRAKEVLDSTKQVRRSLLG